MTTHIYTIWVINLSTYCCYLVNSVFVKNTVSRPEYLALLPNIIYSFSYGNAQTSTNIPLSVTR